jgi:PKD repeat protein
MPTDSLPGSSRVSNRSAHTVRAFAVIGLLFWNSSWLNADTLTATWNRNPESNIGGYILSYGTQSGNYSTILDVGNVTTRQVVLDPGHRYYFVVQAYNTSSLVSPRSAEVFVDVGVGPRITSLSATSGTVGTAVEIIGTGFGATQSGSTVRFNGTTATTLTSWSATRIMAVVPSTATTGPVTVTVGGVASNGITFTVGPPTASPITLTQHAGLAGGGGLATLTFPANNIAGNFIAVAARAFFPNQTFTVTDTRGNFYRRALTLNNGADDTLAIFYAENIAAGPNTVRVATSTSASLRLAILEYAGIARTNALDVTATAALTSASPSSGSATTTAAGDLVIGAFSTQSYRTITAGSGYTLREAVAAAPSTVLMVEDRIQTTAGAVSATATLSASDVWGAALAAFKRATTGTNLAPTLTQPANQTSAENATISLPLVASDPEGAALTYSATGLPPVLSLNPATGLITGTLTFASAGTHSVTATVSDGALTNSKTFTWTVSNVNRAPTLTQPANQTSAENAPISLPLVASDPDGTALTYSATGLPPSLSVNPTTGVIAGTLTSTSAGTHTVTATASDGSLSNSKTFTWTVTDVAQGPRITSLSATSGTVGTAVEIIGTGFGATQSGSTVRFNVTTATTLTSWSATRIMTVVPSTATTGPVTVTVGGVVSNGITFTVGPPTTIPITLTQQAGLAGGGGLATLSFPAQNIAGNFIAVAARAFLPNQTFTVTDTRGNFYRRALTLNNGTDDTLAIFYAENIVAGPNMVTVATSTPASLRLAILEYAGIARTNALDVTATAALSSASPSSGSATTTAPGLVLGAFSTQSYRTITAGSGYTTRVAVSAAPSTVLMVEDRIQTTAGAVSATATLNASDIWGAALAAFKRASDPAPAAITSEALTSETLTTSAVVPMVSTSQVAPRTDGDYDGDGKADVAVFTPAAGAWSIIESSTGTARTAMLGAAGDRPVPGDYEGDGKTDVAVYRPATGEWSVVLSSTGALTTVTWGLATDLPVPADYDGDGKTDVAVYRPATGEWILLQSASHTPRTVVWGSSADVPVPGDYDGDMKADLAVYRPTTGLWQVLQSGANSATRVTWGGTGAMAVSGDYDGDGRIDVAVYYASTGLWSILQSSANTIRTVTWGASSDVPMPGDYDGDGATDLAAFRPSTGLWQILRSSTNTTTAVTWGMSTDVPVPR